jgi:prolyl oligopeptidase
MKPYLYFLPALALLTACGPKNDTQSMQAESIKVKAYPTTDTVNQVDDYHGSKVADPYRWLEEDTAAAVKNWVNSQNDVTQDYLSQIPYRQAIAERYTDLFNFPKVSAPSRAGEYFFFYKNDGLQNQSVIYVQKGLKGQPEVFVDPNALSKEGTTTINLLGSDESDKYMAVTRSVAGSDWGEIRVIDIATKKELKDQLKWVKFSGAAWYKDGFFYSRYPAPAKGQELSGNNQYHSIYYHKLGDDQTKDKLVYEDRKNPNMYHNCGVTEDYKYLVMYAAPGTDGFATYIKDLEKDGPFVALFPGSTNKSSIAQHLGNGRFLAQTDIDAPNYRLIEIDAAKPDKANWKTIIAESKNLLEGCSTVGKKLFASYLQNATTRIYQMDYDGKNKKEIQLPGLGSAGGFYGEEKDDFTFYSYSSFVYPGAIFKYDLKTGKSEEFFETKLKFDPADYEEKQVFYPSKDGTKVSMFVVHKKGLKLDGKNPTFLYGYGGFNISMTPGFSASRLILLENGGVFAMPNLRGGGEYGENWHQGGMLLKKQNVFDDFIAAAEYLIKEGYTSKEKLAISGGSNGGLLVGAAMTQRPDLFAVAFPAVGVMDMLRYHKFTVGKGWIPEYGSADDPKYFSYLKGYSPLHNLKPGVKYPSTMVTTADHDDRVVPAHSFKFAAQLQKSHKGENPVLIRIETNAGHGAGKPTSKIIEEVADQWSFFFYNTNSPVKYLKG